MTCQSINKKAVSSLLIVFSFFYSFSQEAEKTYHREFSKLSFVFQPSYQTGFLSQNNLPYAAMGEYKIYNLENTPDKFGIFNINGDFYGLSFQVTPKKGWLKRTKKSIK